MHQGALWALPGEVSIAGQGVRAEPSLAMVSEADGLLWHQPVSTFFVFWRVVSE